MRELTHTQIDNVGAAETRPIFLVYWAYGSPEEYLSCSGAITYDGQAYTAGGVNISSIQDSKTAVLTLPATSDRIIDLQTNLWRGGVCKIYYIPGLPGDSGTYTADEGLLLVDGLIESMRLTGEVITVNVKSKYYLGSLAPKFQLDEIANHLPPVGTLITWEGETISYEQWIRTTTRINELAGSDATVVGRVATSDANTFTRPETGYVPLTGEGVHLPLIYGRTSVPGYVFASVVIGSPDKLLIGVAWCLGEVKTIEQTFINDAVLPSSGVSVRHYRGTPTQETDPWLALFKSGYDDDMVYNLAGGDLGVCYSVFLIDAGALTGAPRFRAIIQGMLVEDPDGSGNSDPFYDQIGVEVDFLTGTTDTGPNAHTLTYNGSPIPAPASPSVGLPLSGSGQYVSIADDTTLEISGQDFTLEIEASATSVSASPEDTETLFTHGSTTSPQSYSIQVDRIGDKLYTYMSSDGLTWDILNAEATGTITTTKFRLVIERVGQDYIALLNGVERWHYTNTSDIYDSGSEWWIGAGTADWTGIIRSFRLTVGAFRYGSPHSISNTPFSDSGNYSANLIYSTKPALAWNDLATNSLYGLGATTTGVAEAIAYGDELLDLPASSPTVEVARCSIGLALTEVKRAEQWLDMLATYANCIWFPEGGNLKIRPDKPAGSDNASGRDIVTNGEMSAEGSPEAWVKGTGWTIGSPEGVASSDGTQVSASSLTQTLTTVDSTIYAISVTLVTESSDSPQSGITVEFNSVEVIASQTAAGTYTAQVTASGTSNDIEVIASTDFDGTITNVKCQRLFYLLNNPWVKGSLNVDGLSESDTPNKVVVQYTLPDSSVGAWSRASVSAQTSAVSGGAAIIQTTLDLPGVYSVSEATNKALIKRNRLVNRYKVSFVETDSGIQHQPGDIIEAVNTYRGMDALVWVESVQMIDYGRYRVSGSVYRDEQTEADAGDYDGGNDGGGDGSGDQFPDDGVVPCVFVPPTDDIDAVEIWNEASSAGYGGQDESAEVATHKGTMGVHGSIIVANPGGQRVIYSTDLGATWSNAEDLPPAPNSASSPQQHLTPGSWQYVGGDWYCAMKDILQPNFYAYIAKLDGGSWTWTVGPNLWNDDYTTACAMIEGGELTSVGRAYSALLGGNAMQIAWHGEEFGVEEGGSPDTPPEVYPIEVGPSARRLLKVGSDYVIVAESGTYRLILINNGTSPVTETTYLCTNWNTTYGWHATNGANEYGGLDTILINDTSTEIMQWKSGVTTSGDLPTVTMTPSPTFGKHMLGYKAAPGDGKHWVAAGCDNLSYWDLYHSIDSDGSNFDGIIQLNLPSTQSNSYGSDIWPATGDWWVGYYHDSVTGLIRIIKWKHGSSSGACEYL